MLPISFISEKNPWGIFPSWDEKGPIYQFLSGKREQMPDWSAWVSMEAKQQGAGFSKI